MNCKLSILNAHILQKNIKNINSLVTVKYFNYLGETIEAKTYPEVTMLFSDIVGFTSICATTTPMMVINMLQNLYEQFDLYCGQLDVYKVR